MINLEITQQYIEEAEKDNLFKTPTVLALSKLSNEKVFEVNNKIYFNNLPYYIELPLVVQFFHSCFQNGNKILPFNCELEIKECLPF